MVRAGDRPPPRWPRVCLYLGAALMAAATVTVAVLQVLR